MDSALEITSCKFQLLRPHFFYIYNRYQIKKHETSYPNIFIDVAKPSIRILFTFDQQQNIGIFWE